MKLQVNELKLRLGSDIRMESTLWTSALSIVYPLLCRMRV
jgi:hypothetical protein